MSVICKGPREMNSVRLLKTMSVPIIDYNYENAVFVKH